MTFTVPNEGDATFPVQSELDAGDLEILAAAHAGTGVISGCAVTAQSVPDMTVAVALGQVAVAGALASVTAGNVTITAAHATQPRIDLVVVSDAGAKSVVAGTPAAQHPEFPTIPASSVVIAAVYVPASDTEIGAPQVVDKRVFVGPVDGAAAVPSLRTLGTGAQQAASGTDSRLTDARTPTGSAGGVLSGTYPNPGFAADMATQAELDAHAADTSSVHGITDTGDIIVEGDARLTDSRAPSGSAGGVLGGSYPNPSFASDMATQAELDAHADDTTGVHGIADTTALVLTSDARLSDQRTPSDGSVTSAKIVDGTIVNVDVSATAGIVGRKLAMASPSRLPHRHGLKAEAFDGRLAINTTALTAGTVFIQKLYIEESFTSEAVIFYTTANGTGLTHAWASIHGEDRVQLGISSDLTNAWESGGSILREVPVVANCVGGQDRYIYVCLLAVGTTGPTVSRQGGGNPSITNYGLGATNYDTASQGGQTTIPTTPTLGASGSVIWMAVK